MIRDFLFDRILRATPSEGAASTGNAGHFSYMIGDAKITAIHDGYFDMPLENFIGNAPLAEVQAVLANSSLPADILRIPFTSVVIELDGKTIVLDTSYGEMGPPTAGQWMKNFKAAGFEPAGVDLIVFSHFHADHINGYRGKDGSTPFAKADVMVPAGEWDHWMDADRQASAPEALKGTFDNVHRVFDPIRDTVKTFAPGQELVPGFTAIAAPGHTPGHMAFSLTSKGKTLMLLSDTSNQPQLFAPRPDFVAVFDMDGKQAAETRRKLFEKAAHEKAQVAFFHGPFPATGHLIEDGQGFRFVPL